MRYEPDDGDDADRLKVPTSPLPDYSETTIAAVDMIYFGGVNIHPSNYDDAEDDERPFRRVEAKDAN